MISTEERQFPVIILRHIIETFLCIEEGENYYKRPCCERETDGVNPTKYECRYNNSAHFFQSIATVYILSKKKRKIYRLAAGILSSHLLSKASPHSYDYHIGAHVGQENK